MLNQLELYNAKLICIIEPNVFKCKCRFNHIFIYETIKDWCKICQTSVFNKSLISEINSELDEMDIPLYVKKISKYGIATLNCHSINHKIKCDVDYIPNNCVECSDNNISQTEESCNSDSCCNNWFDKINELSDNETFESLSNSCNKYTKKVRTTSFREDNIINNSNTIIQFNKL